MTDEEAYKKLDSRFRRFEIHRTEMIEVTHYVNAVIYNGMGDFSEFKGEGQSLAEAVDNVFMALKNYYEK